MFSFTRPSHSRTTPRRRTCRPAPEQLEDRCVLSIAVTGQITEFPVPSDGRPQFVTRGPAGDQDLWFTDSSGARIGRIQPNGVFETFVPVTPQAQLGDITAGPDGNVWFLENLVSQVGRITPGGQVTEFRVPNQGGGLSHIVAGPDGNLYFIGAENNGSAVLGQITPAGKVTEFPVPGPSNFHTPAGIAVGSDGALWMTEPYSNEVIRMTTTGQVREFTTGITKGSAPLDIAAGPDGALWFTEPGTNQVGRITTAGVVTEFAVGIRPNSELGAITAGPDGALWFMEAGSHIANQVGRITTDGQVTEFAIPTYDHSGQSITAGADGNVWFTEPNPGKIGRVNLTAAAQAQAQQLTSPNGSNTGSNGGGTSGGSTTGGGSSGGGQPTMTTPTPTPTPTPTRHTKHRRVQHHARGRARHHRARKETKAGGTNNG
jgi:virginiamycin B lyase